MRREQADCGRARYGSLWLARWLPGLSSKRTILSAGPSEGAKSTKSSSSYGQGRRNDSKN